MVVNRNCRVLLEPHQNYVDTYVCGDDCAVLITAEFYVQQTRLLALALKVKTR